MKQYLLSLEAQITDALRIGNRFTCRIPKGRIQKIIFCGMGGSGIGGDVLRRIAFREDRVPFMVNRSMAMPKWVDRSTLVIVSSYSGNTRETLTSFRCALRANAPIIAVTAGGQLERLALRRRIPLLKVPSGFPPRCAIGYLTFVLVPVLKRLGILSVTDRDIRETVRIIGRIAREPRAKSIARKMAHRFVHLYAVSGLMEPVLVRWRSQFAENAKTLVSHQMLPEMFHNEIEGWGKPLDLTRKSVALFFRDQGDPVWISDRRKKAQSVIGRQGGSVLEICSEGHSPLARIFSLIALGDWTSYELARLYRADPLAIPNINALKKVTAS
jgi:glucose/mannose-6-phosphate isomerase